MRAGIESIKGEYLTRAFQGEDTGSIHRRQYCEGQSDFPGFVSDDIHGYDAYPDDMMYAAKIT